jgi:hypothetical protein
MGERIAEANLYLMSKRIYIYVNKAKQTIKRYGQPDITGLDANGN